MSDFPSSSELGQIVSASGYRYQITPEDVLWLARSVAHEGGDHAATVWTYFQRIAAFRGSSLCSLVMAHSQSINPIWRRDGEKCRPGGPYYGRDECSERRLAARDRAASMPWDAIPAGIRQTVLDAAQAKLPNPVPRAIDFADPTVSSGFLRRNPGSGIVLQAGNWYLYTARSAEWPADFVRVIYAGRTSMVSASSAAMPGWALWAIGASAGIGTALLTWAALRRIR